ncbi:hypothetical protein DNTS_020668 [Danionella cerebrum]|uniref:BTB domain-containing protein n=1 Tax=Danionella cerebrum TaxID=2873325 RepID=A0A553PZQ8_9TELE|nr:hypothetical protein DNTS_020668 [Danionella translucida]
MSLENSKSFNFTFQSSVHSSHVLQCLNEQRKKDILCDVTVVVGSQSFRAHQAILASCSDFFSARVSSHTSESTVINLPDELISEGFEPLLDFAYTSKLIFTKENVLEIRNCATVLGFKNLDKACFDFLLPKLFDSHRGTSKIQRKCCKTTCCRSRGSGVSKDDDIDEDKPSNKPPQPKFKVREPPCLPSVAIEDVGNSFTSVRDTDYSLLCPKYRKFQIACGKERSCQDACREKPKSLDKTEDGCPLSCNPRSSKDISSRDNTPIPEDENSTLHCAPCTDLSSLSSCNDSAQSICDSGDSAKPGISPQEESEDGERTTRELRLEQSNAQRSPVEMMVAEQLTSWTSSSQSSTGLKASNLNCLRSCYLDAREVECPFLQEFGAVGAQIHDGEAGSTSQMALPLSVEQIVSLNRNDFQQMLKQQILTREQLDAVHDIRRRSKNRIAARRCRKRKLDCIYNLECEIEKLRSEREKLNSERMKLNQLKLKACQSYSSLYEQVCAEAALRPEQLQVLAKYSSPDCPLSAFLCSSGDKAPVSSIDAQSNSQKLPQGFTDGQPYSCTGQTMAFKKTECCSVVKLGADLLGIEK